MFLLQKRAYLTFLLNFVFHLPLSASVGANGVLWTRIDPFNRGRVHLARNCLLQCADDPLCAFIMVSDSNRSCTIHSSQPQVTTFLDDPGNMILQRCIRDCSDAYEAGFKRHGQAVSVCPRCHRSSGTTLNQCYLVRCDQETLGGGWTVIQTRYNGTQNFSRPWNDYKTGFGNLYGDFWMGNEMIHEMVSDDRSYTLFVVMEDLFTTIGYAAYGEFSIAGQSDGYRLTVSGFQGYQAGDGMAPLNGMQFSTYDDDNDGSGGISCSEVRGGGGWWFNGHTSCLSACLNCPYVATGVTAPYGGIHWPYLPNTAIWPQYSLMQTQMKIRVKGWQPGTV